MAGMPNFRGCTGILIGCSTIGASKRLPGRQTLRLRVSERLAYRGFPRWIFILARGSRTLQILISLLPGCFFCLADACWR
jgi:hypothetical protein